MRAGTLLRAKDVGRAHMDVQRALLPMLVPLMLHDNEEVRQPHGWGIRA
jgi:hypothetical protein